MHCLLLAVATFTAAVVGGIPDKEGCFNFMTDFQNEIKKNLDSEEKRRWNCEHAMTDIKELVPSEADQESACVRGILECLEGQEEVNTLHSTPDTCCRHCS
ncbi:unnamed protein product [Bursaphelenchus xylophilus]|uniref:(pine wood nematode) hypothetical protein n=1 Tax=Bursaphelenchus xylophilus TaxID=6326 RepID=A0A1I7RYV5_BURXY|nr:unnamed protein product [Bursaphelenchus xylophilus]CAG9092166.1 unnamed protein product [Bursaphelenchus xylophilus]